MAGALSFAARAGAAALTAFAILALSGCVTSKEARIRSALAEAGLPAATATCMAEPLARDLSGSQLKALARLASGLRANRQESASLADTVDLLQRNLDPATMRVLLSASARCLLRGNRVPGT